jgi:CheY-like chemotaxis protein
MRPAEQQAAGEDTRTVLVTEDNPLHMKIFKLNLAFKGFHVLEAENGERGLALARSGHPDLILVDLSLPKFDGWQMISQLKEDPLTRRIPIIVVSARQPMNEREAALRLMVAAYVSKPFDPEALMELAERTVHERG